MLHVFVGLDLVSRWSTRLAVYEYWDWKHTWPRLVVERCNRAGTPGPHRACSLCLEQVRRARVYNACLVASNLNRFR